MKVLLISALSIPLMIGGAFAQEKSDSSERQSNTAKLCANLDSQPAPSRALVQLCSWVGQYR